MSILRTVHNTLLNLSFDSILAGIAGMTFSIYCTTESKSVSIALWILLPICLWSLYTLDHLWDASKLSIGPSARRHLFHKTNATPLKIGLAITLSTQLVISIFIISLEIAFFGILLMAGGVAHLFFVQKFISYPKEIIASSLYTLAVWFGVLSSGNFTVHKLPYFFFFFIIVYLNMLSYSIFDLKNDIVRSHTSLCAKKGSSFVKKRISILTACNFFSLIFLMFQNHLQFIPLLCLMLLTLFPFYLTLKHKHFEIREKYRNYGDYSFIILFLCLL